MLTDGFSVKGTSLFIGYTRVDTSDQGSTWLSGGINIATTGLNHKVAATEYVKNCTKLNNPLVKIRK